MTDSKKETLLSILYTMQKDIEGENLETVLATVADWCKVMKHEIISAEQKGE